jgi:hypothetical protein
LIQEECRKAGVALEYLIVGEMEFNKSKVGKVEDARTGGYMLIAENEGGQTEKGE